MYFRTVHSLAFKLMGLKKSQVMQGSDYNCIGEHLGLRFNVSTGFDDVVPLNKNPGDQYAFIDGFSRARKIEPVKVWDFINHDGLNWWEFERYANVVKEYKYHNNLTDFSDMLDSRPDPLALDVCIVDEAQDLSTAQWLFLENILSKTKRVYIAGDDDQAIFEWSGADVNHFINKVGEREVLKQSYRIPSSIHNFAADIVGKIHGRMDKHYFPKSEVGEVNYWGDVDNIDMSSGTWLLLARNTHLLGELATCAKNGGYRYTIKNMDSFPKQDIEAIELWERYRNGKELSVKEEISLKDYASNVKKLCIWHEAFDRMGVETIEYYISLLRRKEDIRSKPRINISTIHGSKGGEADNVILLTDMAYSTWDASSLNMDSELRVWYVGATRAKQAMNIIMPRGRYFFDL